MTDDINDFFDGREERHKKKISRQPLGEPPEVDSPDLLNFEELDGAHTDRVLANVFFRKYRHLFCNGDEQLYMYLKPSSRWVRTDIATHIYSHAMEMSAFYYLELSEVMRLRADAIAGNRVEEVDRLNTRQQSLSKLIRHVEKASTIGNIAKMVTAKVKTVLQSKAVRMNANPEQLACANGVVDLATGELHWPKIEDYITRNTGVDYTPNVDMSWWEERVLQMCHGNARLAQFLQVWFGYCATGHTREHCMAVLHGAGRNGKNVLMDATASALGGYAAALTSSFLEVNGKDGQDSNNFMYMIAQLDGVRMAYVSETGERGKLRESAVKSLTGDKKIRARLAFENFYEFSMSHKFTIGTNHKPEISGTDDGVWSRIRLVPMRVKFGDQNELDAGIAQYLQDETLLDVIQAQDKKEQVLAWIIAGATKYIKNTLKVYTPAEVAVETKVYRREQDVLGQFLQHVSRWLSAVEIEKIVNRVEATPPAARGKFSDEDMLRVDTMELWRTYAVWADDNGHGVMSSTMFARRITSAQRFWPGDGAGEPVMKSLEAIRTDRGRRYIYFGWSGPGLQLRDHARRKHSFKMHDPSTDEKDF